MISTKSLLYSFFLVLLFTSSASGQLTGKVVSIADGDTFTLLTNGKKQVKIRLHGIDCRERGQDYGDVAKKYLSTMIFSEEVRVETKGTDRYGRTIGVVFLGDRNMNESLLEKGLAWHYKKYDKNPRWALLEEAARLARLNLWAMPNPLPPWDFRRKKYLPKD